MTVPARQPNAIRLRAFTPARVGLVPTGVSQQTRDVLDFQHAHALARDAVHAGLDAVSLAATIQPLTGREVLQLHSTAANRATYLQRPDLGRRLDDCSR
jgi:ethanolamine ammonia-lyase small subunit